MKALTEIPATFAARRDESRLLVLDRKTEAIAHRRFRDIVEYVCPGDLLVLNDTKVLRARIIGRRATGGRVEALLLGEKEGGVWEALFKPGGRLLITTPLPRMDWAMRALERFGLNQKRSSPHDHLVALRDVPRFPHKQVRIVAGLAQWGILEKHAV